MTDPTGKAWRALACAILAQAWRDAHNPNGERAAAEAGFPPGLTLAGDARAFLESDGGRWLVLALELDPAGLDAALGELPPASWGQLRLSGV